MSEKKVMTVEEVVDRIRTTIGYGKFFEIGEADAKKLVLSFAAQETKPLVEALEFYADPDNMMLGFDKASGSRYVKDAYYDIARGMVGKKYGEKP